MEAQFIKNTKRNLSIIMLLLILLMLALVACEDNTSDFDFEEYPVVEAYLVPGQAVDRIRVFKMSDFSDSINEDNGISGLQITLTVDAMEYILTENPEDPGTYYYSAKDLEILPGSFCELMFEYKDKIVSSETTIPEKPANLQLSKNSISVSMGGWGGSGMEPIEVSWDNPDNNYFYMVATNIEDDPTPVHEEMEDAPTSVGTNPSTSNLINIVPNQCRYYGTYEMVLFRVNPEFAELSLYTTTNTINLTEPYTNIVNGKGIFTAYASDTAYFEAVSK